MAASSSSSPFFGIRDDGGFFVHQMNQQQPSSQNHQPQFQHQQHPLVLQPPGTQLHQHPQHHQQQLQQQQHLQQQQQQQHQHHQHQEQQSSSTTAPSSSTAGIPAPPPLKKRRNLPGAPNPDAEVIALSPKTLMATNRFLCEVCGKGFQREQNLQLHRRGHNLPWKLKQKNPADAARRRVYVCPEPTCAHHDPSRALGDLTGIKKHFCRKHGEKKWKCDKCSKRYAVHSDWKAHSKTCGTREYRCDCGTLFSRRDSFITHRAFCDALAQESGRHPVGLASLGGHLYGGAAGGGNLSGMGLGLSQLMSHQQQAAASSLHSGGHDGLLRLGGNSISNQFNPLRSSSNTLVPQRSPAGFFLGGAGSLHDYNDAGAGGVSQQSHSLFETKQQLSSLMQLPNLHGSSIVGGNPQQTSSATGDAGLFNQAGFFSGNTTSNSQQGMQMLNLPLSFNHGTVDQHAGQPAATALPRLNLTNGTTGNNQSVPQALYGGTGFHDFDSTLVPAMSATALLQKAAQMGSTMSGGGDGQPNSSLFRGFGSPPHSGSTKPLPNTFSRDMHITFGGNGDNAFLSQPSQLDSIESNHLQDLMNSLVGNGVAPMAVFGPSSNQPFASVGIKADAKLHNRGLPGGGGIGSSDGLTRDFLGVGGSGIIVGGCSLSSQEPIPAPEQQHLMRQSQDDDVDVGSLFNESKAASAASRSRSFASENI